MINPPRRSITRFFIPLVDVMTLLFSLFILMPIVEKTSERERVGTAQLEEEEKRESVEALREELWNQWKELEELREHRKSDLELERLKKEVAELKEDKIKQLNKRIAVFVIDVPATDTISYTEPGPVGGTTLLEDSYQVKELIQKHRKELKGTRKEPYYLFRGPKREKGLPFSGAKVAQLRRWFEGVPSNLP